MFSAYYCLAWICIYVFVHIDVAKIRLLTNNSLNSKKLVFLGCTYIIRYICIIHIGRHHWIYDANIFI